MLLLQYLALKSAVWRLDEMVTSIKSNETLLVDDLDSDFCQLNRVANS